MIDNPPPALISYFIYHHDNKWQTYYLIPYLLQHMELPNYLDTILYLNKPLSIHLKAHDSHAAFTLLSSNQIRNLSPSAFTHASQKKACAANEGCTQPHRDNHKQQLQKAHWLSLTIASWRQPIRTIALRRGIAWSSCSIFYPRLPSCALDVDSLTPSFGRASYPRLVGKTTHPLRF